MKSPEFSIDNYKQDKIRAIDARYEAQKIAFAPLTFQAIRALIDLGILHLIEDAKDDGLSVKDIVEKTGVSEYGVRVLTEMALGMNVLKLAETEDDAEEKLVLGKTGWFLLNDDLTRVNFNFNSDICYKGACEMTESVRTGKPVGLKVFGDQWTTIYEALSTLPEKEKKSWFEFDHFYSDIAFPEALPIVFDSENSPKHIVDIGGNTAKWSLACCRYNSDVHMTIVDLPGQTKVAEENARKNGFEARISTCSGNILKDETRLPKDADAFWMSQFLDCFSLKQVTKIAAKIFEACKPGTKVYVLEPLWDKQKYEGNAYSVMATSLYFTCMANGNSKMYRYGELVKAIEAGGLKLKTAHHNLGTQCYSLLVFEK